MSGSPAGAHQPGSSGAVRSPSAHMGPRMHPGSACVALISLRTRGPLAIRAARAQGRPAPGFRADPCSTCTGDASGRCAADSSDGSPTGAQAAAACAFLNRLGGCGLSLVGQDRVHTTTAPAAQHSSSPSLPRPEAPIGQAPPVFFSPVPARRIRPALGTPVGIRGSAVRRDPQVRPLCQNQQRGIELVWADVHPPPRPRSGGRARCLPVDRGAHRPRDHG